MMSVTLRFTLMSVTLRFTLMSVTLRFTLMSVTLKFTSLSVVVNFKTVCINYNSFFFQQAIMGALPMLYVIVSVHHKGDYSERYYLVLRE